MKEIKEEEGKENENLFRNYYKNYPEDMKNLP